MASKDIDEAIEYAKSIPDLVTDTNNEPPKRQTKNNKRQDDKEWKGTFKVISGDMYNEALRKASENKDKELLEKLIKNYYDRGLPTEGNEILEEAGKSLDIVRTKEALVEATKKKNVKDVELIIQSIKENDKEIKKKADDRGKTYSQEQGYHYHMLYEIAEAKKLLRVVESGREKNRHIVPVTLKLDRNIMSEIKRYKTPPDGVHDTMKATFLLLGLDEEITEDWSTCAKMSNPEGRQGLNRRLQVLDISNIEPEICARAKEILEKMDYKKIRRASAGGATFYIWAKGTIDQYEEKTSLEGVVPANKERQMELLRPESERNRNEQPMFMPKINKPRNKVSLKPDEQFQRNLRAPHSGGRAADILVEPKQYSKSDY